MAALRQRRRRRDRRGHDQLLQPRRDAEILIRALLVSAAFAATPLAQAQEDGVYVGGALGQAKFSEWCDTGGSPIQLTSCDDATTAWKLFGGYRFNAYLGAEASFIDWGEVTASTSTASVAAKQRSYGVAGVASFPLMPQFSLQAKLGFLHTDQETSSPTSRVDRGETELHYGLGARYAIGRGWSARGEWENTDKLKVRMLSLAVEYRL